jgi:hypothetical protein
MPDDRSTDLLGQLPRTRPHRRSTKRPERSPDGSGSTPASDLTSTTVAAPEEEPAPTRPKRARDGDQRPATTKRPGPAKSPSKRQTTSAGPSAESVRQTTSARPRAGSAPAAPTARLAQPAQPRGIPAASRPRPPQTGDEQNGTPILKTAAQATVELAEIGFTLGARALRQAINRLPRP